MIDNDKHAEECDERQKFVENNENNSFSSRNLLEKNVQIDKLLENLKRNIKSVIEESVHKNHVHEESNACFQYGIKRLTIGFLTPNTILSLFSKISKACPEALYVMEKIPEFEKMIQPHNQQSNSSSLTGISLLDSFSESSIFSSEFSIFGNSSSARDNVQQKIDNEYIKQRRMYSSSLNKCLCIRAAIVERKLLPIVQFLLNNYMKYYETDSIIANEIYGNIFYHLLTGPCSLEYSRMKSLDIGWIDPPAKELIDRQKIYAKGRTNSSGSKLMKNNPTLAQFNLIYNQLDKTENPSSLLPEDSPIYRDPSNRRQSVSNFGNILSGLFSIKNSHCMLLESSSSQDHSGLIIRSQGNRKIFPMHQNHKKSLPTNQLYGSAIRSNLKSTRPDGNTVHTAREYVEWLHQNCHTELIYGKNNVLVNTSDGYIQGYLSLHLTDVTSSSNFYSARNFSKNLLLKWTPNLAVYLGDDSSPDDQMQEENYWRHAFTVNMENIVYIHCHHQSKNSSSDSAGKMTEEKEAALYDQIKLGDSIILIRLDGVQLPPLFFPKSSNASFSQFLIAIEEGLRPNGHLEPSPSFKEKMCQEDGPQVVGSGRKQSGDHHVPEERESHPEDKNTNPKSLSQTGSFVELFSFGWPSARQPEKYADMECIEPKTEDFLFRVIHKNPSEELYKDSMDVDLTDRKVRQNYLKDFYSEEQSSENQRGDARELDSTISSIDDLCSSIRKQILTRTIKGWYEYYRMLKMMRSKLSKLIKSECPYEILCLDQPVNASGGVTKDNWLSKKRNEGPIKTEKEFYRHIYFGGCQPELRQEVWLTLLGVYPWEIEESNEMDKINQKIRAKYDKILTEWMAVEAMLNAEANLNEKSHFNKENNSERTTSSPEKSKEADVNEFFNEIWMSIKRKVSSTKQPDELLLLEKSAELNPEHQKHQLTSDNNTGTLTTIEMTSDCSDYDGQQKKSSDNDDNNPEDDESKVNFRHFRADASLSYSHEIIEAFSINIHRIDKDVARCDRNYAFYSEQKSKGCLNNLGKLRNIMASWVWEHMDVGYVQGMCDILAPILVIMKGNEHLTYMAFSRIMRWSIDNFPKVPQSIDLTQMPSANSGTVGRHLLQETELEASKPRKLSKRQKYKTLNREEKSSAGLEEKPTTSPEEENVSKIDKYLDNLNSLIEFLDPEVHQLMNKNGDNTYFYFCYRWFLLDFKREMKYEDIFKVWETIWSARMLITDHFNLFIALALILFYRDNIICYNMDFTDIIRFFNERAEHHDAERILSIARNLLFQLQSWIKIDGKATGEDGSSRS